MRWAFRLLVSRVKNYITLIRPHQWIKNLFIFAPFFFGFHFSSANIKTLAIGFGIFCLSASAVYILNDFLDVNEDRLHPTKRNRPLAAGNISKSSAMIVMLVILSVSILGAYLLNRDFFYIILIYVVQNILYSYKLKHISILDISLISTGFVLRILAGAVLIQVQASVWIVLVTFLLSIFLALAKRRDDVLLSSKGTPSVRRNIDGYNLEFVNAGMILTSGMTICAYVLYTVQPEVMLRFGSNNVYLTSVFVIMGILRYMQITFVENNSGNPTLILLKDTFLQFVLLAWLLSFMIFFLNW